MDHREEYKLDGWIYTAGKDLCPDCRPKDDEGKNYRSKPARQ
jgi:hypothetical protein